MNEANKKITINDIKAKKGKEKIVAITAYDALMAGIFDGEGDIILVGDSLKMSFGGENETLGATMEEMLYHTKAVCKGASKAFIIADMPFGSYSTKEMALKNALRFYKESKADAIKLEVGLDKAEIVRALCNEGIAVMAHIGLMPQYARFEGGFKVKGKIDSQIKTLLDTAVAMQESGAFGILCEGIKSEIAESITQRLSIPTIGIGAGVACDGQILVWSDVFGFFDAFKPKFVRRYCDGKKLLKEAIKSYARDIRNESFPSSQESY
ncbi:3-methyl-2-oxobutanoate hydroxymethyltransferase [Helicobacter sp. MIT 14-3879]|uniref:3-methyl-2-oxobutanoate hydroxymethyltransferase n=1 Tax=Helicobacter sp. MIT 14-3879 TaxID=2040649 RepID=UPI000E1FAB3D|nr:3-methyl-2-oxobutanoate hydroxymethyltransferase [Helicobacter sp. MIT 14-3879]RDU59676.1 3-methyl-2-oxobutanoate hydroxymethyltransferase [Helicobacter sp. MIT 14-3879]